MNLSPSMGEVTLLALGNGALGSGMDSGGKLKVVSLVGDGYDGDDDRKGLMEIDSENGSNGVDFIKKKMGFGILQAFEKAIYLI
ncbi:hypothetical protein L6452_17696 [Arctium lappa]|uniref:Uncharacterized protein n=1 Tax=Arctium lappa TaxID=4217 RepID=A0ACB9C441_ARCLA|nr:hypothetical protein L6452_17696 [Arctium lappa]